MSSEEVKEEANLEEQIKPEEKVEKEDEELKRIKEEVLFEDEEIKEERILILNLRDSKKAPLYKRSKKAINLIKEMIKKYTKQKEVWIDTSVNENIWKKGIKKPPLKIKLRVLITNKERALALLSK